MKTTLFIATIACCLATVGLRADPIVNSVLSKATQDPKNAPMIALAMVLAAEENKKSIGQIVTPTLAALPDQTVRIVRALFEVTPKQHMEVLRAAILGQPTLVVEITSLALGMFPDQASEIVKVALDAAPDNLRLAVAALGNKTTLFESPGRAGRSARGPFPAQPVRPDLVSPSR